MPGEFPDGPGGAPGSGGQCSEARRIRRNIPASAAASGLLPWNHPDTGTGRSAGWCPGTGGSSESPRPGWGSGSRPGHILPATAGGCSPYGSGTRAPARHRGWPAPSCIPHGRIPAPPCRPGACSSSPRTGHGPPCPTVWFPMGTRPGARYPAVPPADRPQYAVQKDRTGTGCCTRGPAAGALPWNR